MLLNPPSRKTPPFRASISLLGLIHFTSFSEGKWGLCKHCEWGEFPREKGTTTPDQRGLLEHKFPKRTFTFYGPHCLHLSPPWILNYLASSPTHPSSIHGPQGTVSCLHRRHWPHGRGANHLLQRDQLSSLSVFPVSASSKWRLLWLGDCPAELTATILGAEGFFWYQGSAVGGGGRLPEELSLNFPPQERGGGVGREKPPHLALGGTGGGYLSTRKKGTWSISNGR